MTIQELCQESHTTAQDKGWWEDWDRNIFELLWLFSTEITEAGEELRNNHLMAEIYYREGDGKPEGFVVELADLLIRVGDTVQRYGLTDLLERALREKMDFNKTRPYRHGGKSC